MRRPILVVDDDADSRQMLAFVLQCEGHDVVTASNGMEAFNLAREHLPSLILLDLMMPIMGGEEFRTAQLANDNIKGIPVVVLSAHHEVRQIARRINAVGCLQKPLDFDAVLQVCERAMRAEPT